MPNEDLKTLVDQLPFYGVPVDPGRPTGVLRGHQLTWSATQAATIADTTETTLWTYTMPTNVLREDGRVIRVQVYGTCAANGNTKTVKLYFGANVLTIIGGAVNGTSWWAYTTYIRTAKSAQQRFGFTGFGGTVNAQTISTPAEDTTGAIVIKVTGTNGTASANDIVFNFATVELL